MPEKKTFAIIGNPVKHSLSPEIHSYIYKQLGLPHSYKKIQLSTVQLKKFIMRCKKNDFQGFNVTIPHKVTIIPFLDEIKKQATCTGAVNTVINENSVLRGYNTDVAGCRYALERSSWEQTGKVVILGAGGACRAALAALLNFSPSSVRILNRNPEKAYQLKKKFSDYVKFDIYAENIKFENIGKILSDTSLLINTTPVGMWPCIHDSPVPEADMIPVHATVFDMVPNPVYTRLLKQAEHRGASTINGGIMLVSQAIAAQEIWLNQKLPEALFHTIYTYLTEYMSQYYEYN